MSPKSMGVPAGIVRYCHEMSAWNALLWGLLGGAVAEALNLSASMRPVDARRRWRWPWGRTADRSIVLAAVGLRLFVGHPHGDPAGLVVAGDHPDGVSGASTGFARRRRDGRPPVVAATGIGRRLA
jgi:hypothetical protein